MNASHTKTENEILESRALRDQAMERLEVLDKVKQLFLLPKLEMMTTQQVADYYETDREILKKCYQRNEDEINSDGAARKPVSELTDLLRGQNVPTKNCHGYKEFDLADGVTMRLPNSGSVLLFPKRAILRIGMLLRDSEIAKELRTQLLNTFEKADAEQSTEDLRTEEELLKGVITAFQGGDPTAMLVEMQALYNFQRRHIDTLSRENDAVKTENADLNRSNRMLSAEILSWSDRASLNKAVRVVAGMIDKPFGVAWKMLYDELLYKHGINLRSRQTRRRDSAISTVREDEWPLVQQSLCAICENSGISPAHVFRKAKLINATS